MDKKQTLLVVCAYCQQAIKINGQWVHVKNFTPPKRKDVLLSHGICNNCFRRLMKEMDREES